MNVKNVAAEKLQQG